MQDTRQEVAPDHASVDECHSGPSSLEPVVSGLQTGLCGATDRQAVDNRVVQEVKHGRKLGDDGVIVVPRVREEDVGAAGSLNA